MPLRSAVYVLLLSINLLDPVSIYAQPAGYYSAAEGLTGNVLQQVLHDIIDNHIVLDYSTLPDHFEVTDKKSDGNVWDMYTDIPGGTPVFVFNFNQDECGNYAQEGDCFNREHSFPKSWFNDLPPMYSDLFHIYPTDGWVNGKRANYPYGITDSPAWISSNGSRLGPSSYTGYSGTIFEPANSYKGDLARTFFYMAVRYYREDSGWTGSDMVTGSQPKSWALNMLREWDLTDPVSQKEKDRNNAVYQLQGNRNPFIDNPSYVNLIWGTSSSACEIYRNNSLKVWPVPAKEYLNVEITDQLSENYNIKIIDLSGRVILDNTFNESIPGLDVSDMESGFYVLVVTSTIEIRTVRIIVMH